MATLTFKGGIHPYDGKELTKDKPIRNVLPKGDLVYPMQQHIGAPAKPVVKKGDRVLAGQKIAEAGAFVSAPVYATVSGTVKAIEPRRVVTGEKVMSIVVENDELYEETEAWEPLDVKRHPERKLLTVSRKRALSAWAVRASLRLSSFLRRSRTRLTM